MGNKTLEKIFSVKNNKEKTHKVITVLGTKIKIKKDDIERLKEAYENYKIMHDKSLEIEVPDDLVLQLCINNYCNCDCKFCSIYKETKGKKEVMGEDLLYNYFKPLYPKTKSIVPTYGELTICPEGYKYMKYIHENYPEINLFLESNGIAFDKKWQEFAADSLLTVKFSVNAIDEESFKKTVLNADGVFTRIKNNIEAYNKLLDEKGLSDFRPSISSVLNSTNYHIVKDFVKMAVSWKMQRVGFYFDVRENIISKSFVKDKKGFDKAVITILELERLLKDKVYFYFRLFMPVNIKPYEEIVNKEDIEEIKNKYFDIYTLAKDFDYKTRYKNKTKIRKQHNKKILTYFEDIEGTCWHKKEYNGEMICENPWTHIRMRPDGRMEVCAWRGYRTSYNIRNFIKNGKINWHDVFNDLHRRKLRKKYLSDSGFEGCMKNCVAAQKMTKEEFDRKYGFEA